MNDPVRDRWQRDVIRYDVSHQRLRQVAMLVRSLSPERVVDLGCATGRLATLLPGIDYWGCDFVEPSAEPGFRFFRCDLRAEPLPPEVRDVEVAVASGLLEYLEDVPGFLKAVRERLRPGGHAVVTYFNMNHVSRLAALALGRTPYVHPDWRGFHSPRAVHAFLRQAGLEVVARHVTGHGVRTARGVDESVEGEAIMPPRARPWSQLFAHQWMFVARAPSAGAPTAAGSPQSAGVP